MEVGCSTTADQRSQVKECAIVIDIDVGSKSRPLRRLGDWRFLKSVITFLRHEPRKGLVVKVGAGVRNRVACKNVSGRIGVSKLIAKKYVRTRVKPGGTRVLARKDVVYYI